MKVIHEAEALGFEVDTLDDPEGNTGDGTGTIYSVYTPHGKEWAVPEGAPHITMEWSAAGVRRLINAELIDCEPDCEANV